MTHKKICIKCNELKELKLFKKDKGRADGRRNVCLACHNKKRVGYNKKCKEKFKQKNGGTPSQVKRAEELGIPIAVLKTIDEVKEKTKEIRGTKEFQKNEELKKKNRLWKKQISFENSVMIISKVCSVCSEDKSITEFYPSKRHRDGYEGRCKKCNLIKSRHRNTTDEDREKKKEYDKQYRQAKKLNKKEKSMELRDDDLIMTRVEVDVMADTLSDSADSLIVGLMALSSIANEIEDEHFKVSIEIVQELMKKEVANVVTLMDSLDDRVVEPVLR